MLLLGSVLGIIVAGLMLDGGGMGAGHRADDDDVDPDGESAGPDEELPPVMPQPDPETPQEPDSLIEGSDDLDVLMGTAGPDLIRGGGGADDLRGGLGDDTLEGGSGDDWIQGDAAYGLGGNDVIHGGSGNDLLAGQGGDDLLFGDEGDDTLFGGEGDDTLFGGPGNDFLSGNDGNDVLISTEGSDDLDGGRGDDVLIGHDGPETVWMNGGEGDDTLMPGANDFASGNSGADMFILHQAAGGIPTIADFDSSEDQLVLHLDADVARTAQLSLHEDEDGTFLLNVNGNAIGRLLQHGGLRVEDVRIVPVKA